MPVNSTSLIPHIQHHPWRRFRKQESSKRGREHRTGADGKSCLCPWWRTLILVPSTMRFSPSWDTSPSYTPCTVSYLSHTPYHAMPCVVMPVSWGWGYVVCSRPSELEEERDTNNYVAIIFKPGVGQATEIVDLLRQRLTIRLARLCVTRLT